MFGNFLKKIVKRTFKTTRTSSGEFLLKKTDYGIIRVEFAAVQKIAERAISKVKGIRESEMIVEKFSEANPLKIILTITLLEGYSAPRASEALDKMINDALKEFLRLEFYVPVEVKVREIAQVVKKGRRVR